VEIETEALPLIAMAGVRYCIILILPPEGLAARAALELPYLVLPCGEYGNNEITVELSLKLRVLILPLQIDEHVVRPERPDSASICSRGFDQLRAFPSQ
jgi:hypothetical protein